MYLERLFASAGTQVNPGLINQIIDQLDSQIADNGEEADAELTARQLKNRGKKIEEKRKKAKKQSIDGFKRFVALIKENKYHAAVVELIELAYLIPELNGIADFHALLTLNYVALRKYYPAEQEEKNARRMDKKWELFDKITDDSYESGVFFLAEYMRTSVRKFKEDKKIVEDLHWDQNNFNTIIEDLGTIFNLESEEIWKSVKEEEIKLEKFDEGATLEDLIIQLCHLFVLPFYTRLELAKIAGAAKLDANNS